MQPEVSQPDSALKLWSWILENQKRLIQVGIAFAVLAVVAYAYASHQENREIEASEALSKAIPARLRETPPPGELAQSLLKIAADHSGTKAALHATLRAGSALFTDGKYAEAQTQFEKYLAADPGSPFAAQAAYGIAASLDAAGKGTEAAAKYEEVTKRYPTDGTAEESKLALANLYTLQNKPEMAYKLYDEILQTARGASGQEAYTKHEELAQQFPYLRSNTPSIKPTLNTMTTITTNVMKAASNIVQKAVSQVTNQLAAPTPVKP